MSSRFTSIINNHYSSQFYRTILKCFVRRIHSLVTISVSLFSTLFLFKEDPIGNMTKTTVRVNTFEFIQLLSRAFSKKIHLKCFHLLSKDKSHFSNNYFLSTRQQTMENFCSLIKYKFFLLFHGICVFEPTGGVVGGKCGSIKKRFNGTYRSLFTQRMALLCATAFPTVHCFPAIFPNESMNE